ncbi:MAG TPA: CotH kinase family protein [Ignavibacteria bacterium]
MKKILFSILFALLFLPDFSSSQVVNYNITMTPAYYDSLYLRDPYVAAYLPCIFEYLGTYWNDASIRFKGSTTRYYPKKGFRFKFAAANLFQGWKTFNLNPMFTDKSFIREKLCWDIFKSLNSLTPDPLYYVSLKMNNLPKGVYLWIENIDKYFYTMRGRPSGPTWEANGDYSMADLTIQPLNLLKLYYTKQIGDTNYYTDLQNMIIELNNTSETNFPSWLNNTFDVNSVYNWLAVNNAVAMGDSYNSNYYLYRDTTKINQQWYIIPWDYDLSFGRDGDPAIPYPGDLLNNGFAYQFEPFAGPDNVLKDRVINNTTTSVILKQKVKYILDSILTEQKYFPKIDSLKNILNNEVANDPLKWGTYQEFNEHTDATKYFITARKNFLYNTYINQPSGEYEMVTIHPTQINVPYRFVDYDGGQIGSMTFYNYSGLDSITMREYPHSMNSNIPNSGLNRYINRYYKFTLYPSTATFNAKVQFEYEDYNTNNTEVKSGVQDERMLNSFCWNGSTWNTLQQTSMNPYSNTINIDNFNQTYCTTSSAVAFYIPTGYPSQFWFRIPNANWQRLYDIKFTNANTGFMIGEQTTVLKTTNAGLNWVSSTIGNNFYLYKLAITGSTLFAAGDAGIVFKSANLGTNWTMLQTGVSRKLNSIYFINANEGWAVGEKGCVVRTTNGGTSWTYSEIDTAVTLNALEVFGTSELVTAGSSGKVYRSINSGANWTLVNSGTVNNIFGLKKSGTSFLVLAGDQNLVMYSNDKGQTWNNISVPNPAVLNFKDAAIIDSNRIYVCGNLGRIFYTPNKGVNWFGQYTAVSNDLNALYFIDSTKGLSSGNEACVLRTNFPGTVGVGNNTNIIPEKFALYQNYPNPFNPVTKIRFDIANSTFNKGGFVTLKIYDILGKEIATLVNEKLQPGIYEEIFNGSNLPSGVYFYRLEVKDPSGRIGDFIAVKKLVMIK